MTKYLTLIFKNLLRTKRRTILTILSIAVSLFIFSVAGESANFCQPDAR
jgi:cell division protein FtsX